MGRQDQNYEMDPKIGFQTVDHRSEDPDDTSNVQQE